MIVLCQLVCWTTDRPDRGVGVCAMSNRIVISQLLLRPMISASIARLDPFLIQINANADEWLICTLEKDAPPSLSRRPRCRAIFAVAARSVRSSALQIESERTTPFARLALSGHD
jgi:hypothetical protein